MSRTSRRISRPLIAALAVVVAIFIAFTVHKVHQAHAQSAPPVLTVANLPVVAPPVSSREENAAPKVITIVAPEAPTTLPSAPDAHPTAIEPAALVTQTPTEKAAASDPAPQENSSPAIAVVSAPPPTVPDVAPANEPAENDATSLQDWAKGAGKSNAPTPGRMDVPIQSISDAKTKLDAGDLISARKILNDNLIAGRGDADGLKKQIEEINMNLIFSARKFPDDPWGGSYQVAGGERLASIAARNNVTWECLSRINGITPRKMRSGQWIKVIKGPFFAVVTKHSFKMDLYLGAPGGPGSMFVRTFMVGLGKDNSTPTGLWSCKAGDKIRNPRYYPSRGGDIIAPDDPKNPLGGYWIAIEGLDGQALGKESYGIHGTIEPDSVGKMSSQGCIRLRSEDISWVFDLLVDGKSKVLIKD